MSIKRIVLALLASYVMLACTRLTPDQEKYGLCVPARMVTLQSDSLEMPYTARFNRKGQLHFVETRNFDGSFRYREDYHYNSIGQLEEITGLNSDNELEIRYEYDMDGDFVRECRIYGMNNQEMYRWIHTNDGHHIVNTEYLNEGELRCIISKTFSGSSYIEESRTPEGELIGRAEVEFLGVENRPKRIQGSDVDIEIEYNDKYLPTVSRNAVLNSVGSMEWVPELENNPFRYYSYEYDKRGNWITRTERVHPDSSACAILRRKIKY